MRVKLFGVGSVIHRRWPLLIAAWAVPALLASLETWIFWRMAGRTYPFWRAVMMEGPSWLVYAVLTPLIFALTERFPLERARLLRNGALHLALALLAGAMYAAAATAATNFFTPTPNPRPFGQMAFMWYLSALPLTILAYFCIVGVAAAVLQFTTARQREVDAAQLTAQLADARLAALRMQLHPHFLFNTLNAITVLARDRESESVVRMLTLLSELLRDVLRTDHDREIPLAAELAFARRYLEIELVRFGDRLSVENDVDESLDDALVPAFILQPLIENALRHGIGASAGGGVVRIGAKRAGAQLALSVADSREHDGHMTTQHELSAERFGVGLSNTSARLRALFSDDATLAVMSGEAGTTATIRMPLRRDA